MDEVQFERLMKAVDNQNEQLRLISIWVNIVGTVTLLGLCVGLIAWVASIL